MAIYRDYPIPPSNSPRKLIMVTSANNNKVYNMTPQGSTLLVEWGRVGAVLQSTTYPISKWASLYCAKIDKGYKDVTDLVKESVKKSEYKDIGNKEVAKLFDKLMSFAKTSVKNNYTISSDVVTAAQVSEAQGIIDELTALISNQNNGSLINKRLLDLYAVIPRRMTKVQNHLVQNRIDSEAGLGEARKIIDNEQATLDVMRGQVQMHVDGVSSADDVPDKTLLDILGIEVEPGDSNDEKVVRNLMGPDAREFRSVYRVTHNVGFDKFNTYKPFEPKVELFWHGSRNENWISILQSGLKIRPSNAVLTGAMFGHGIYFADKYRKSANYTSLRGSYWAGGNASTAFLSLMSVHVGKQYVVKKHNYDLYSMNKANLLKKGNYDSLFAQGGYDLINNEYIVYDEAQSTIRYLVEVGK